MGLLLAAYHLLLAGEKMHGFNRFYLLGSLFVSFIIPLITIEIPAEMLPVSGISTFQETARQPDVFFSGKTSATETYDYFPLLVFFIYGAISLAFLCRFLKNLTRLITLITKNSQENYKKATLVLLQEKVLPHTFLHYIFINKKEYEHQLIEEELLAHERTHVQQKHTYDILFVELLKILLWFNPLVYLYEKAIRLNHEFLADEAVLKTNKNVLAYQQLLLQKASCQPDAVLASSINFSLTKKRLIMMTQQASTRKIALKKVALLPLLLALVISFSIKTTAQQSNKEQKPAGKAVADNKQDTPVKKDLTREDSLKIIENYWKNSTIKAPRKKADGTKVFVPYDEMTEEEKLRIPLPTVSEKNPPTQEQLNEWTDSTKYGVWIDSERIANADLRKYAPTDFGNYGVSRLAKNAKNYGKHEFQVNLLTLSNFEKWQDYRRKAWDID